MTKKTHVVMLRMETSSDNVVDVARLQELAHQTKTDAFVTAGNQNVGHIF